MRNAPYARPAIYSPFETILLLSILLLRPMTILSFMTILTFLYVIFFKNFSPNPRSYIGTAAQNSGSELMHAP
jgi:hypothetical protein